MSITEFLDGYNPDPETKRVMGIPFEMARVALEREWGDHVNAVIATRIIDLAKGGERNPDVLCDRALARRGHGMRPYRWFLGHPSSSKMNKRAPPYCPGAAGLCTFL